MCVRMQFFQKFHGYFRIAQVDVGLVGAVEVGAAAFQKAKFFGQGLGALGQLRGEIRVKGFHSIQVFGLGEKFPEGGLL